jgi:hypothetical protein
MCTIHLPYWKISFYFKTFTTLQRLENDQGSTHQVSKNFLLVPKILIELGKV